MRSGGLSTNKKFFLKKMKQDLEILFKYFVTLCFVPSFYIPSYIMYSNIGHFCEITLFKLTSKFFLSFFTTVITENFIMYV